MGNRSTIQANPGSRTGLTRSSASCPEQHQPIGPHLCVRQDTDSEAMHPSARSLLREVVHSSGHPLDEVTRSFMEPRFDHDFSKVLVHIDRKATESARILGANAFTVGNNVVFGNGKYAPTTKEGQRLLAHELTHVIQQEKGASSGTQFTEQLAISEPGDYAEKAAERVAETVTHREPAGPRLRDQIGESTGLQVQRQKAKDPMAGHHTPSSDLKPADMMPAQIDPEEAWGEAESRIEPEFENAFQDVTRAAAADAKWQVHDLVEPYDGSLSDPNKTFLAIAGAFLGGAGNFPQDPPPKSAEIAAKYTVSVTGGLSGVITQGIQGALGILLDTGTIQDVKETANLDIEEIVAQELTLDSAAYKQFESGEISILRDTFLGIWSVHSPDRQTKEAAIHLGQRFRELVRQEYGVHGERGQQALDNLGKLLHAYLESKVRPQLEEIKKSQKNRRLLWGATAGGASGLILGGAIGYATGGSLVSTLVGGGIGLGVGALSGLLGGALVNAASSKSAGESDDAAARRRARIKGRKPIFTGVD